MTEILTQHTIPAAAARDIDALHRRFLTAGRLTPQGPPTLVHSYIIAKDHILQCELQWTGTIDPQATTIDWKLAFDDVPIQTGHRLIDDTPSTYYRRTDTGQELSSDRLAVHRHTQSLSFLVPNPAQIPTDTPFHAILTIDNHQTSTTGTWNRKDDN